MMLEIVYGYSRDFKVKCGGDKSKVMVINGDETDRDREWNIGEVKIGRTKEYKYLGCMLSEDGCARAKGESGKSYAVVGPNIEQISMNVSEEFGSMLQYLA
ncbi:hypothetical protein FHG87_026057 [Trinorchestia longiramus]|nr:hypothetical protein FHG87_026057 [Trinorchestia longiramus]